MFLSIKKSLNVKAYIIFSTVFMYTQMEWSTWHWKTRGIFIIIYVMTLLRIVWFNNISFLELIFFFIIGGFNIVLLVVIASYLATPLGKLFLEYKKDKREDKRIEMKYKSNMDKCKSASEKKWIVVFFFKSNVPINLSNRHKFYFIV